MRASLVYGIGWRSLEWSKQRRKLSHTFVPSKQGDAEGSPTGQVSSLEEFSPINGSFCCILVKVYQRIEYPEKLHAVVFLGFGKKEWLDHRNTSMKTEALFRNFLSLTKNMHKQTIVRYRLETCYFERIFGKLNFSVLYSLAQSPRCL